MFILIIGLFLCVPAMVSPVQAQVITSTQQTFILSNEGGGLISQLTAAGYGALQPL